MSRVKNTIINTAAGVLTRVSNILARFVLQTVLIYVLGIQYTGISGLFTSILTILSLAELGIGNAIAYELYRPLQEKNVERIAQLMNFYRAAYRLVAIFVLGVGIILIPFLGFLVKDVPDIKESIRLIYMLFIVKTVASYLLIYKSTLLIANQQNYIVSQVYAAVCVIKTIVECVMLVLTKQFLSYLILEVIGTIGQNIWISLIADKKYPELRMMASEKMNPKEKRTLLGNIKGLAMYKASFALGNGVDNIVISSFISTATVGLVSNYTLIRKELEQLIKQFYNAVIPSIGNLSVTATAEKQYEVFSNLFFLNYWLSSFCCISYFVLIQPTIVVWIGQKYMMSIAVAAVLGIDFYLSCMLNPIASFRTANGIFRKGQYRPAIMVIINVGLSVWLGARIGVTGVFIATILSRLMTQWYDPYLLHKIVFKKSPKGFYYKYYSLFLLTIALGGGVFLLAEKIQTGNIWINLVIRALLCLVLPNGAVVLLFHRSKEYHYCIETGKKLLGKIVRRK